LQTRSGSGPSLINAPFRDADRSSSHTERRIRRRTAIHTSPGRASFCRDPIMNTRAKALVASARAEDKDVEENLVAADTTFRDVGYPYSTA